VKDPDFGVAIGVLSTAANTDVDVDYVTLEVTYNPPVTGSGTIASQSGATGRGSRIRSGIGAIAVVALISGTGTVIPYAGAIVTGQGWIDAQSTFNGAMLHHTWDIGADEFITAGTTHSGAGTIAGVSALTGSGIRGKQTSGTVAGVSALTARGGTTKRGSGTVAGVSALTGAGTRGRQGAGSFAGISTFGGVGTRGRNSAGSIAGVSTLAGVGTRVKNGAGSVAGVSTLTGAGKRVRSSSGTIASVSTLTGAGQGIFHGHGAVASVSTLSGVGIRVRNGIGSVSGVSTLTGAGRGTFHGHGTIASVSTLTGYTGGGTIANKNVYVKIDGEWVMISPTSTVTTDADGGTF
jgi:hypothetical protein